LPLGAHRAFLTDGADRHRQGARVGELEGGLAGEARRPVELDRLLGDPRERGSAWPSRASAGASITPAPPRRPTPSPAPARRPQPPRAAARSARRSRRSPPAALTELLLA